jgi:hypothetical protein
MVMFAGAPALAGMVYINSSQAVVSGSGLSTAQAKLRFSHTNWDQSLDRGTGTSSGNFISTNIGSNSQTSGKEYHFSFSNIPGEGFIFSLTSAANTAVTTLSWGSFSSPPTGSTTLLLNGFAPGGSFNGLLLEARATRANSMLTFRELAFTSQTLSIADGAFVNGSVSPIDSGPGEALGSYTQRLVADSDLSLHRWTFSGLISGTRDANSSGDEEVKFAVGTRNFTASLPPVPAPGAVALLSVAGIVALGRRVR